MITKDRLGFLARSLAAYCRQDYARKELVIVNHGSQDYLRKVNGLVDSTSRSDIRVIACPKHVKLGELRNRALDAARGPLICQWDDDDLYHPQRLSCHIDHMVSNNAKASFLTEQLQFFWDTRELFLCDWSAWGDDARYHLIPNTLLAYKNAMPQYPSEAERLEDRSVRDELFFSGKAVRGLGGSAHLTIYTYHGANVYDREHHRSHVVRRGLSAEALRQRFPKLKGELETYPHLGDYSLCGWNDGPVVVATVQGRNGIAQAACAC